MATITKTFAEILTHQAVTHPGSVYGADQDVATKLGVTIFMSAGFSEAAANTNPGSFIVQIKGQETGDEDWYEIQRFTIGETGTPADEALTATEPIGETVLAVAATAGFAALDNIYILHTTLANSEWAKLEKIATDASLTLTDGLTSEQTAAASTAFGSAQRFAMYLSLTGVDTFRVIFMHEGGTGANMHVRATAVFGDSIG